MDKEKFLSELADAPTAHYAETPFEELSEAEQVFITVRELDERVADGGFRQYFEEPSGDHAARVLEALEEIGADQAARLVERAMSVFGVDGVPLDQESRIAALESLSESAFLLLEELDSEYVEYPDDLVGLLYDYVQSNKATIHGLD